MKKNLKFKISFFVSLSVILIAIVTSVVYAFISTTSTRGEIEVSAATITAETTYTSSTNSFAWTYVEAGDTKQINIATSNQTGVVLHRFYNIQLTGESSPDENLLKAIIVYYNDEYVGTLNNIISNNPDIQEEFNFIGVSSNSTDNFKFELHQAAKQSIFDSKNIAITITTYTENADYYKYIFVKDETDFKKAIDDVNSGLFTEIPSIVLCNNITLENNYTILDPVKLYLNGSTLNGSLTINDTNSTNPDALLEVLGTGTFNVTVTLGSNYDTTGAITLVKNYIKEVLANGLAAGSTTDILGYYSFYGVSIAAVTRCTYTAPNVIIADTANEYYNALGSVRVNNDENISFKILGTKTALLDETLAYMPEDGATITSDLFLPTYIPSQNANITWTSSDESIITSTGMITADRLENAEVTLYAEIKVNETIITRRYNFKVSAHNNEINFYKLVQEISPIVINNVRNSDSDDDDALYYLPIVSQNNDGTFNSYDYRTSYKSPVNTELFDWKAFKDIGLENITYSMTQQQLTAYDYITQTNNNVYLNTTTLNNYAQITITGDFGNSETYTTNINISISVGSNTQLLEKAFTQVSEELANISVLGNILSTRITDGMKNEKGDFSLNSEFTDKETNTINEDYTIEYSGAEDIIDSITYNSSTKKYDFTINPEYFNEYETTVAFTATVYYKKGLSGETSKNRTFYVTVPAALHISDFGTISIYNSTKYQVFNQLPSNEKVGTTGYTASGTLTDSNLNYILLRDIVGDANYLTQYDKGNGLYLTKINYTSSNYASGTESLSYQTASSNPTSTTDTAAYDFARLIEWATGNTRVAASTIVSNTTALGTYASKKSNAEDYLNDDEIAVLKQYYCSTTNATDAEWDLLFSEVFSVAPGYIYTNPALLNQVIKCLSNQITGENFRNGSNPANFSTIFGKYMEIIQRYAVSTTTVNANDVAPCQEIYNTRVVWTHTSTNDTTIGISNNNAINVNGTGYTANYSIQLADGTWWQRFEYAGGTSGDGSLAGIYARKAYSSDRTSYITEAELTILRIFLLNAISQSSSNTTNYISAQFNTTNLDSIMVVVNANQDYYSGYLRSHFDYIGEAILNAFNACMEIPTYFATDGVAKIIKSFYDKKDYKLPSYDGTVTTSFVSSLNSGIPYITNADNIKSVLSYFVNLKTLTFNGNANLAAFLSENGLSTVFARTGLYNKEITSLTMKHVAHTSVIFDLTNIKNFTKLTTLDLSNNSGIQSVNELVNVNRSKYTLVNIEQIGVEYEYQEFAIDNIASSKCTVRYTNSNGIDTYSNDSSRASDLSDLSDFNKFITQYMYMTNVIYNEDGTVSTTVTWRIDEGNEINNAQITNSGKYPDVSTISEMNQMVSPFYYCSESFTYNYKNGSYSFVKDHIYKVGASGSAIVFEDLGTSSKISNTNVSDVGFENVDLTGFNNTTSTMTTFEELDSGTTSTLSEVTWYTENNTSVTITITGQYYWKNLDANKYLSYRCFNNIPGLSRSSMPNNTNSQYCRVYFLTLEQVNSIINKTYTSSATITEDLELDTRYYLCFIYNNQLYMVGNKNDTITTDSVPNVTTSVENALTYTIVESTTSYYYYIQLYENTAYHLNSFNNRNYISYHTTTNKKSMWSVSDCSTNGSINYTISPNFRVTYMDDSYEEIDAYSVGYTVTKIEGVSIEYSNLKSINTETRTTSYKYYYYIGSDIQLNGIDLKTNTIIAVSSNYDYAERSITRKYIASNATIYLINVWYRETNTSDREYLSNPLTIKSITINTRNNTQTYLLSNIRNNYPADTQGTISEYTYVYDDIEYTSSDEGYSDMAYLYDNLTSNWVLSSTIAMPYATYTTDLTSSNTELMDKQIEFYYGISEGRSYVFRFIGAMASENIYLWSSIYKGTTYSLNHGYNLTVNNGILSWEHYADTLTNAGGTTMDSILATANQHFGDYHYGEYYGKYYAYNGNVSRYISSGIYVRKGYIYRIIPNKSNTAFCWVEVGPYVTGTSDEILESLGTGVLNVGDICYSTKQAEFGFFNSGWYKVILDEKTNIVNLVKFNDVGFLTNGATTYTQLTNNKLVARSGDYLGYSGTFTVRISAMIRTYDSTSGTWTEYIKTYKLKFVGSLTS